MPEVVASSAAEVTAMAARSSARATVVDQVLARADRLVLLSTSSRQAA